jgi:4-hydroxybenzoyl-CoA reductase subunit beta
MLPLPIFRHHAPASLDEAMQLLAELGGKAQIIAGGTDLLPNMKHGLFEPEHLVSLARVEELASVTVRDGWLTVGAMMRLAEVASHAEVRLHAPALAQACGAVGGPHHRRMGTLGGNVCLDTRCVYYNQTYFWREALGFCLKKDGTACHVVTSGKNCVAAASNDSAPVLMALEAQIVLVSAASGQRIVAADDFYTADGIYNTVRRSDEIVKEVRLPIRARRSSGFDKLRRRGAIDFPLLNAAARIDRDPGGRIEAVDVVVSTLAARPRRIHAAAKVPVGTAGGDALWRELAAAAHKQCKPLTNLDDDPAWRREMLRVVVRKALEAAWAG